MNPLIRRSDFYLIPNIMSVSRILAIPIVSALAYFDWNIWAAIVFALAGISDYIDGWIARRYHYESKLGMLLDPLADKIIVLSVMVMLLYLGRLEIQIEGWDMKWVAPLLVIVTVGREIAITGLRSIASTVGIVMPADKAGKIKTWIQFFAMIFVLTDHEPWLAIGRVMLIFSVIAALWSAVRYTIWFVRKLPE